MRICLHLIWSVEKGYIGGSERFVVELARELKNLGFTPFILCTGPNDSGQVQDVEVVRRIPNGWSTQLSRYGLAKAEFFQDCIASGSSHAEKLQSMGAFLIEQLKGVEADILHFNSFPSAASYAHRSIPSIATNHENRFETDRLWGEGFFDWLADQSKTNQTRLGQHRSLFVPSRHYAREYTAQFGQTIEAAKQGIALDSFPVHNLNPANDLVTILLPSRFDPEQKGHDVAVRAAEVLTRKGLNFRMVFSGVRDDYVKAADQFRSSIRSTAAFERIEFHRFADMNDAYRAATMVVSPERSCSYGLSISEALAIGMPTILSDIPTYREIARNDANAYFFPVDDADALAETILEVEAKKSKSDQISRIRFRAVNDMRDCARFYARAYLEAYEGAPAPLATVSRFG